MMPLGKVTKNIIFERKHEHATVTVFCYLFLYVLQTT